MRRWCSLRASPGQLEAFPRSAPLDSSDSRDNKPIPVSQTVQTHLQKPAAQNHNILGVLLRDDHKKRECNLLYKVPRERESESGPLRRDCTEHLFQLVSKTFFLKSSEYLFRGNNLQQMQCSWWTSHRLERKEMCGWELYFAYEYNYCNNCFSPFMLR